MLRPSIRSVACVLFFLSGTPTMARTLSFEQRVAAQEALDRIVYSHEIGATRAFEDAVPRAVVEQQVHRYLKHSAALETIWKSPIDGTSLAHELARMATETRMPARLAEQFHALDDDPLLVAECLVRPVLAQSLVRSLFDSDPSIHASVPERAWESWWAEVEPGLREDLVTVVADTQLELPVLDPSKSAAEESLTCDEDDTWKPIPPNPTIPKGVAAIWTGSLAIVWDVCTPGCPSYGLFGYRYDPVSASWTQTAAWTLPSPSEFLQSIWAGDRAVVWDSAARIGARYDPISDTWQAMSNVGAPPANRMLGSMIWTGTSVVVWGGQNYPGSVPTIYYKTGGRYDPVNDSWTGMAVPALVGRSRHTAVWTGTRMIVWGGISATYDGGGNAHTTFHGDGGTYDPDGDVWAPISATGAPSGRAGPTGVWTGSEMIVWGGYTGSVIPENTGGAYRWPADTWLPTPTSNAPAGRDSHTAVWTGRSMIVWGGTVYSNGTYGPTQTGGRYDPVGSWLPTTLVGAPPPRSGHFALWTGSFMFVWGWRNRNDVALVGGLYALDHSVDDDGDGLTECAGDCNDGNGKVWARPGEVRGVGFDDRATLHWLPPSSPGGTSVAYDALRASAPDGFGSAICLETAGTDTLAVDSAAPANGSSFFYLVRARNACPFLGTLGANSTGAARLGRTCP